MNAETRNAHQPWRVTIRILGLACVSGAILAFAYLACNETAPGSMATSDAGGQDSTSEPIPDDGTGSEDSANPDDHDAVLDGSDLPPDKAWLADPNSWKSVPETTFVQPCVVYAANLKDSKFEPAKWTNCGPACEEMDVLQGYSDGGWLPAIATKNLGGTANTFIAFGSFLIGQNLTRVVWRLVNLSDGAPFAALQLVYPSKGEYASCMVGSVSESATFSGISGGADPITHEGAKQIFASAPSSAGGAWKWSVPATTIASLPAGLMAFDTDYGDGQLFQVGKGTASVLLDPTMMKWTSLESNSSSGQGGGDGDLAVWTDFGIPGKSRVRGWAPDGQGIRTILDGAPETTCHVVPSPTQIVGWAVEGDATCSLPKAARLWKAPRSKVVAPGSVTSGPVVPPGAYMMAGSLGLRTWGDWAAVNLLDFDTNGVPIGLPYFVLVKLSTWEMWRVNSISNFQFYEDAFALSDTHFYYAQRPVQMEPFYFSKLSRLNLAAIDSASNVKKLP